jgi:parallel beta-helix repeat protein
MQAKLRLHAAPATVVSLALLGLAVAGLVALSGANAAGQGEPKCGDRITTDTTLHHNLVNCPNNGLKIGADNVTLDLNYHRIDGDGTPAAGCDPDTEFCDVGVLNRGHDGVTVVHGSVRQFNVGVWGLRVSHNRLLGISSSGNECCGLGFFRGTRSLVRNSSGSGSVLRDGGVGMFLIASHHVRVLHNSFRHNGDQGIFVADATNNLIKGNRTSRNEGLGGITLERSDRNRVRRNRSVRDGEIGIYLAPGSRNVIARNRVSHPSRGRAGVGIEVDGGDHNVFARNSIRDTEGNAIGVGFAPAVGTVVRGNRIRGAGGDGVNVDNKATHTRLKRNHAFGAKDDGLDVNNSKTKLTRNETRRNGDLGIEAVRGVTDGGGNRASGNGDPRQCTHIACD